MNELIMRINGIPNVVELEKDEHGNIAILVGGYYILDIKTNGTIRSIPYVDEETGLNLNKNGRVIIGE